MDQIIALLKRYLANSVVLSSTAHGFHWNTEGPLFTEYHELFGSIYEDVDGTIDVIAEWIRIFGEQAPYTLEQFIQNQNYGDVLTETNSPIAMSRQLLNMNNKLITDIKTMFDVATENKEQGLANFLADRQTAHEKFGWFLRSILTPTVN